MYIDVHVNKNVEDYFIFSVSSVLNRDTKQFGKKYLLDGEDDTCWNSDQVHVV